MPTQMIKLDEVRARVKARQIFSLQDLLLLLECRDQDRKVGDLSTAIGMPKPAVTRGIKSLESQPQPFLSRREDLDDRRSPWIRITPAGKKFLAKLIIET